MLGVVARFRWIYFSFAWILFYYMPFTTVHDNLT